MSVFSAGHFANARYSGRMRLPMGMIIRRLNRPGKPALEHIFQKAIIGSMDAKMMRMGIRSIGSNSSGPGV